MKVIKVFFILSLIALSIGGAYFYYVQHNEEALPSFINKHTTDKKYIIKKAGRIVESTDTLEEAIEKASSISRSIAINTYNSEWVYADLNPYFIISEEIIHDFESLVEAIKYAKKSGYDRVYYKNPKTILWEKEQTNLEKVILDVPLIQQNPELPRGCEVTSLAMIMKYAGINVDKMTLAEKVNKETSTYIKQNGKINSGNPYEGFVGDMYDNKKFGYGVYNGPIEELAKEYFGERVENLTGLEFEEITYLVKSGYPVWIITNATYRPLDDSQFEIWHTPTGIVKITFKLHSVVITGVDNEKIYINDPLSNRKNIGLNKEEFKKAWEQMGNQAIVILEE